MAMLRVLLVLMLLGMVAGGLHFYTFLSSPLSVGEQGYALSVVNGDSIRDVALKLKSAKLIDWPAYLRIYARFRKDDKRIRAGEYQLIEGMKPSDLLALLVSGPQIQYSLTIVEGWTFRQMRAAVAANDKLTHELSEALSAEEVMAKLGYPGEHPEGRFFPDTYFFSAGMTDIAFFQRAYNTMATRLEQVWAEKASGLPLKSAYQALILASIIEKESGIAPERAKISGVFTRRLQKNMRLQADPTVIYGLGERYTGTILKRDLKQDTPYNTYTRHGLPPTPIALPGSASLSAAVHPEPGNSLYFVADGRGGHVFSATLDEHNKAVREYRKTQR